MNYIEIFQDLQLFKIFQVLQRSFKIFKKCSTWEVPIRSSGNNQVLSQLFDNYFFFLGGEGGGNKFCGNKILEAMKTTPLPTPCHHPTLELKVHSYIFLEFFLILNFYQLPPFKLMPKSLAPLNWGRNYNYNRLYYNIMI